MQPERSTGGTPDEPAQLDLAAIGLAVFFVTLIVVVGLLLLLPAIV